jgi:hypothetical protein
MQSENEIKLNEAKEAKRNKAKRNQAGKVKRNNNEPNIKNS